MSRYRFALRPLWILSHLFVLALVGAMVTAGLWQLDRLQEKKDRNDTVLARTAEPVVPVTELVGPADVDPGDLEFRRVTAQGEYLAGGDVLVGSPTRNSTAGSWVFTPLVLDDGTAVAVNRGWIANPGNLDAVPPSFAAPRGPISVTGLVRSSETRGRFGPVDPGEGTLTRLARADLGRLDQQVDADLLPVSIQLEVQDPAPTSDDPAPADAPALDEGPHLSYAVQWFIFTAVAVVGYPLILRKRARDTHRDEDDAGDGPVVDLGGDERHEQGVRPVRSLPGA